MNDSLTIVNAIEALDDYTVTLWVIKQAIKHVHDWLEQGNEHHACVHLDIALSHLRLAEYVLEGKGE